MSGSGFFIDCNTLDALFRKEEIVVKNARKATPERPLHLSVITQGEINFGHSFTATTDQVRRDEYENFISTEFPSALSLDFDACEIYGSIRAELFRRFGPTEKTSKRNRVAQLCDVTDQSLGIDENDLWLASHAIARGFVLVSEDRMERIKDAAEKVGYKLQLENWLKP